MPICDILVRVERNLESRPRARRSELSTPSIHPSLNPCLASLSSALGSNASGMGLELSTGPTTGVAKGIVVRYLTSPYPPAPASKQDTPLERAYTWLKLGQIKGSRCSSSTATATTVTCRSWSSHPDPSGDGSKQVTFLSGPLS